LTNWGKILLTGLLFFTGYESYGQDAISLSNFTKKEEALGDRISVFEDLNGNVPFDSILHHEFSKTSIIIANNRNKNTAFWLKFDLRVDENLRKKMVFEILDFKIDSFELYLPLPDGGFKIWKGGDAYPFDERDYSHKNFVFDLPSYKKGNYTGYIRVKASEVVGLNFAISNLNYFHSYSTNEYLVLSLFYGVVIAMALFSLILYVYLFEKSYLFYALYILSLGFYFLTRDGLGFQYIWSDLPLFNSYCKPISVLLVVTFHIFFVQYYLNVRKHSIVLNRIMYLILFSFPLFAYLTDSVAEIIPDPLITVSIPFLFLFILTIKFAMEGNIEARFFAIAYAIQFFGFFIFTLAYIGVIETGVIIFYSINIASALEIIVFSVALAGKVKSLIKEIERAKDSTNKILEEKVRERTKELEERNNQLDVFVYKASHDIKGPLKSMIGLTKLALAETEDPKAAEYFQYIHSTSSKLDNMVEDLLRMGMVKDLVVKHSDVRLKEIILTIIETLKHFPGFEKMKFNIAVPDNYILNTDETLIYSIFQNIIENALKYMDDSKEQSFLNINFSEEKNRLRLDFEDNGLGIPEESKKRIFDMFYKVNHNSSGSGLGLYLTKFSVEKLGGKMELTSEEKKGTTFTLYLNKG
jgi:signal transduction histidine kinase